MPKKNTTVHLLILDPSQNDAEVLVSLLRNSGKATRAHRVTSEEDLEEALGQGNWDLFLARDVEEPLTPDQCLRLIKKADRDVPSVLLMPEENRDRTVEIMKAGAHAAIPQTSDDLILLTVNRELASLAERRQRRIVEAHLRESEQRCQLLLESSKDAIAYINDGMHIYANQSYMELLGYDDIDELICIPVLDTLSSDSQADYKSFMKAFMEDSQDNRALTCTAKRSDDREIGVVMQVSAATYDGEPCTQVVLQTQQNDAELEEKLRQISSEDLLTGLFNRQYLMDLLTKSITRATEQDDSGAFAYIAIDNFIQVRSKVGISGADVLLGDLSRVLLDEVPEEMTLARLSDDAFGILCTPCKEEELKGLCETLCQKVHDHLFDISGQTVQLSISVGIAPITENAPKAEDLMGRAHTAAAEVRHQEGHEDGNGVLVYSPVHFEPLGDDNSVEAIQQALDEDRFRLLFQPIINLRGEGEEHYEAFVRMLDKDDKEVSPYDFLPPAGPSDMASKIDRWVVLQTIKHLSSHRSKGHDTRLFLNVTNETIQDKTFTSWLSVALKAARLPGASLIFQIREGDATNYMKQAREFTKALGELHCKTSIAQFGGALNPFNTLKHVDVDYVKIDGSFTEEIQKKEDVKEEVKEMVKSLQSAGKLTIVPLVENASVLATLWQAGVNYIQGYYLQAPVPEMTYDFGDQ
ncbi:diguanylate cyclase/phosphodiesterase [Tamilnaduibacter salinus]|uniref:Diguanylate cyclase n=1 Tax=Tamilnaduibacter salinus TaxID=1484056 RepID=A0A2A2I5N9_9GAMM|nr:EAL domain-containing protein [Tamilnaduibacter salinus]PAV26455.1 diguanylate cyclase [Tamilnaduibacter salinus]PVY70687.1 diguanylate cyclase/phosphodiesterase [Tamilnaduibacter salinus]